MKVKKNNGIVAMDTALSIVAIIIFSTLIISLIYNNFLQNIRLRKDTIAIIYLTETLENIGIESYDNINTDNVENLVPKNAKENGYDIQLTISNVYPDDAEKEDIIKKIVATISYELPNKKYSYSMERMKIKE